MAQEEYFDDEDTTMKLYKPSNGGLVVTLTREDNELDIILYHPGEVKRLVEFLTSK